MPEIHINPDQNLTGHIEVGELQNLTGKIGVGYVYPTLEELEVTPTTENQLIYPERYGFSQVEVEAVTSDIDSNIQENNIRKDVEILGITGTLEEVNAQEKTATPSTSQQIITPDNNYNSLSQVTIEAVTKDIDSDIKAENIKTGVDILGVVGTYDGLIGQEKTATPTTSEQVVTPDEGYTGLTKVTIEGVTKDIDANIVSSNIKAGVSILGVQGNVEPDKPDQTKTANPSTQTQVITPDIGYELASVTINPVTSSIDSDIQSGNIKSGVEILGVNGSVIEKVGQNKTATPSTSTQTIVPDTGYNALNQVEIEAIDTETKEVKSTTQQQTIYPTTGKFIDEVVVNPIKLIRIEDSINWNGRVQYTKPQGYDGLGGVYLNVEVVPNLQDKEVEITENGTTTISADEPYEGLNEVEITTNVSGTEDLNTELTAQDTALASQELKIQQMIQALENKKALDLQQATSDATARPSDIAMNKTAYVNGVKIRGTSDLNSGLEIYVQDTEPQEYNGIWIKSNNYSYSNLKEINTLSDIEASAIHILKGNSFGTKLGSNLTYQFGKVYITNNSGSIIYDIPIYYGDGTRWLNITPITGVFMGITADFRAGSIVAMNGSTSVTSLNCFRNRKRCNMADDGTITAYYGDTNYNNVGSENLQVMVEQPKVYYSLQNAVVDADGTIERADYIIADTRLNNTFELHPAFIKNGVEYDKIYVGAYEGTIINDKLSSIGGGTTIPSTNKTRAGFRTCANNRGNIWSLTTKQYEDLEALLMSIENRSFNHQSTISAGVTSSSSAQNIGQTYTLNSYGTGRKGSSVSTSNCFTWRWRENKYGNVFKYIDGLNVYGNVWYIKDNNFADDTDVGYTELEEVSALGVGTTTRFAYVPNAKWVFMPKTLASSQTGIIRDDFASTDGWHVGASSGTWNWGASAGSFYLSTFVGSDYGDNSIGATIMAIP